jgi:hypothetical protein
LPALGLSLPWQKRNFRFRETAANDWTKDRYNNDMLKQLAAANDRFVHVDLCDETDPEKDRDNELHLKNSAFDGSADKIHQVIIPMLQKPERFRAAAERVKL